MDHYPPVGGPRRQRPMEYLDAMTSSQPTNASEWQLYRVLQRANLLQYYDTFIAQGGDDVQQLCEAGEEEFLEIMALVGMASKPLHVRRLQKALQEWVANPAAFQGPVVGSSSPAPGSISASVRGDQSAVNTYPSLHSTPPIVNAPTWNPATHPPPRNISPANTGSSSGASPQADIKVEFTDQSSCLMSFQPVDINMKQHSSSSPLPTPVLVESQIIAIAEAATRVAKESPGFEPKELNLKKQINREIQLPSLTPLLTGELIGVNVTFVNRTRRSPVSTQSRARWLHPGDNKCSSILPSHHFSTNHAVSNPTSRISHRSRWDRHQYPYVKAVK